MFAYVLLGMVGLGLIISLFDDDDDTSSTETTSTPPPPPPNEVNRNDVIANDDYESELNFLLGGQTGDIEFVEDTSLIFGGPGDDDILGGRGDDTLNGATGRDLLIGGEGDDVINLGRGDDVSSGGFANTDPLFDLALQLGDDQIFGGRGQDVVVDNLGSNTVDGGTGDDSIAVLDVAEVAPDTVYGGIGDDTILFDQGDLIDSGFGADEHVLRVDESELEEPYDPAIVENFSRRDTIEILIRDPDYAATADITTDSLNDGEDTGIYVDGTLVAVLDGVSSAPTVNVVTQDPAPFAPIGPFV